MTAPEPVDALLPCPFCGGDAEMDTCRSYRNIASAKMGTGIAIYCRSCDADMMRCREDVPDVEPAHMVEAWNTRAQLAARDAGGPEQAAHFHSAMFSFEPGGLLYLDLDGAATLTFPQEEMILDEGEDECGPTLSIELPAKELPELRNWLNKYLPVARALSPDPTAATEREGFEGGWLAEVDQAKALMNASALPSSDCGEIVGHLVKAGYEIVTSTRDEAALSAPVSGTGTREGGA